MNRKIRVIIILILASSVFLAGRSIFLQVKNPASTRASGSLNFTFPVPIGTPLFSLINFKPGDCLTKTITAKNDGNKSAVVAVKGIKINGVIFGDIKLENILNLKINSTVNYFDNYLSQFFTQSSSDGIILGNLDPGMSKTYDFKVCFPPNANNDYQRLSVIFDLQFGSFSENYPRMTGGGQAIMADGIKVGASFELNCDPKNLPNNLEINWGKKTQNFKFHLHNLTSARCFTDFNINPGQPKKLFNTYIGQGAGTLNDKTGVSAWWTFTDAGEPGRNDTLKIIINDKSGNPILNLNSPLSLSSGNFQAH